MDRSPRRPRPLAAGAPSDGWPARSGLARAAVLVLCGLSLVAAGALAGAETGEARTTVVPASAAEQIERGFALYRLYCVSCHGDELLGLTPSYIAQWPPEDQNCWQSKCHIENHPPDGFVLPRDIPALAGVSALTKFRTAADLFAFVRARMPYQNPQWLSDEEYWAVVAYVLDHNGVPLQAVLGPENASQFVLRAAEPQTEATPAPTATPSPPAAAGGNPTASLVAVALGVVVAIVLFLRRRGDPRPSGH